MKQLPLPIFDMREVYSCPLCGQEATLFGQFSPFLPWGVCRDCSIKYRYPAEVFVPSTRRNADHEPLMVDPSPDKAELRERRVQLDEMLRCAVDPSRLERPIVKYNLSGLELRNPIRRSRMRQFAAMTIRAKERLRVRQINLPFCDRCGCAHERWYEMLTGVGDYWSKCQRCEDELAVLSLWKLKGIFGDDDVESIMDRLYRSHQGLFERGALPDYWFVLMQQDMKR
jgi:hypothetical protein